jgi:predicted small lipoprotein YifL
MKRCYSILLIILVAASLAACSQQAGPAETPAPSQTEAQSTPAETPVPSPSPTPEPEPFAPEDIFGGEFNPYSDAAFPEYFSVYGASFDIGVEKLGGKPHYVLSMTAGGEPDDAVMFLAELAGLDEAEKTCRTDEFNVGGFCEFQSADGEVFTVRKTDPNDDRYEYIEGIHADISVSLTDAEAPRYIQLVRDNFNVNALAAAADFFDTTPVFEECDIAVNLHKKEVSVSLCYTVAEVAAVQTSLVERVKSNWYDAQHGRMGLSYGMLDIEYLFDITSGNIYISERSSELNSALSAYIEPEVSLSKLGFGFGQDGLCGVYEQHEPHYMSVAIHRPEWGAYNEDWNIEFMDEVNGYLLRITYSAAEESYHISADKDQAGAAFDYLPTTKEYTGEYPDQETVKRMFGDAFGTQSEGFYEKPLAYFEELVRERFGMGIGELYALPKK